MTLLTYNIQRGGLGREQQLADVINGERPDVVVLQEATDPGVVRRLAEACAMPAYDATRGRSLAFMSRMPIAEHRWVRPRWSQHAFLEIAPADHNLRIFGVHLSAVHAAWTEARRVRELRALLAAVAAFGDAPHVLIGDFNTLAPDERLDVSRLPLRLRWLVWLSGGRIRWQTIAIVLAAGYVDSFRRLHPGDEGFTFPTWNPHVRLDYAFLSTAAVDRLADCRIIRSAQVRAASDHFPLRVDLHPDA